jgi:hypothetical protein
MRCAHDIEMIWRRDKAGRRKEEGERRKYKLKKRKKLISGLVYHKFSIKFLHHAWTICA